MSTRRCTARVTSGSPLPNTRNGPTGKVEMQFAGWRGHFKEADQDQQLAV